VEETLRNGENMLLEIDVQGALQVKEKFPGACLIFIAPPGMEELERRLRGRGTDSEADIQNRLAISREELALQTRFDHVVINEDLDACFAQLRMLIRP
jgi:guanylate kinase